MRKNLYIKHPLVLKKLETVDNQSKYVTNLILDDIKQRNNSVNKDEVIRIIKEYLSKETTDEAISPELRQSISSILKQQI